MIVVDANIAAKWYLPEAGSDAALDLLSGPQLLCAPDLIRVEVLAALTRRVRTGEASPAETLPRCQEWLRHLHMGALSLVPEHEILDEAIELSLEIKHTLQDCLYLAVARRIDATLVTADTTFQKRAAPHYGRISLLPGCEAN